mmetsp:Transcript_15460/g.18754  ORF Transcript_15460/g.18754 Transcript_15460/m.18754 type:complete len:222 (-) Transcript_15460:274-939(-)
MCKKKNVGRAQGGVKNTKQKQLTGWWDINEQRKFVEGLKIYGRSWKKVAGVVGTRSSSQVRSHAQKFFLNEENRRLFPRADKKISKLKKRSKPVINAIKEKKKRKLVTGPTAENLLSPFHFDSDSNNLKLEKSVIPSFKEKSNQFFEEPNDLLWYLNSVEDNSLEEQYSKTSYSSLLPNETMFPDPDGLGEDMERATDLCRTDLQIPFDTLAFDMVNISFS